MVSVAIVFGTAKPERWSGEEGRHAGRRGRAILDFGGSGLCFLTSGSLAQVPEDAALGTQEDHPTRTLPAPDPHWVYILEPVFPYLVSSKVWILNGDNLDFVGMASAGYTANLVLSHDQTPSTSPRRTGIAAPAATGSTWSRPTTRSRWR